MCARVMLHLCLWMCLLFYFGLLSPFRCCCSSVWQSSNSNSNEEKKEDVIWFSPKYRKHTVEMKRCDVAHTPKLLWKVYSDLWLMRPFTLNVCLQMRTHRSIFVIKNFFLLIAFVQSMCVVCVRKSSKRNAINASKEMEKMKGSIWMHWQNVKDPPEFNENTDSAFPAILFVEGDTFCFCFVYLNCGFAVR